MRRFQDRWYTDQGQSRILTLKGLSGRDFRWTNFENRTTAISMENTTMIAFYWWLAP